ncbi:CopG family transcriptional regulator [Nocardia tengchongensis]|uniref:ribbon-helix-helix domain-containing protein n=1 Tax=Nocardia tengchongensis TaxID=2055889 RepID=UPI0036755816
MNTTPDQGYPRTGEEADAFLNGLTFDDTATMPPLPPTADEIETGMVTTSLKLPAELRQRVKEVAAEHCINASMLIRQYIEMGLASEQPEQMIPLSDAIRVLSALKKSA